MQIHLKVHSRHQNILSKHYEVLLNSDNLCLMLRTEGVRLQLKAESAAHTETHAKFVECEQEVDSLRKMKTQVDEYRGQCAESAIQVCAKYTEKSPLSQKFRGPHLLPNLIGFICRLRSLLLVFDNGIGKF